jgi:hypothetical protein
MPARRLSEDLILPALGAADLSARWLARRNRSLGESCVEYRSTTRLPAFPTAPRLRPAV